jgi:hypothetical protein
LLGLVYDPHPSAADFPQQSKVAQAIESRAESGDNRTGDAPGSVKGVRLEILDQAKHREELADLTGQIRIATGIVVQRGSFAPAAALEELFRETLD